MANEDRHVAKPSELKPKVAQGATHHPKLGNDRNTDVQVRHGTLVANVTTTITFDGAFSMVEVLNVTGTAAIYFTIDGTNVSVGSNDAYVVPAQIGSLTVSAEQATPSQTIVRLISSGTPGYSVTVS